MHSSIILAGILSGTVPLVAATQSIVSLYALGLPTKLEYAATIVDESSEATTLALSCSPDCGTATMTTGPSTLNVDASISGQGISQSATISCDISRETVAACATTVSAVADGTTQNNAAFTTLSNLAAVPMITVTATVSDENSDSSSSQGVTNSNSANGGNATSNGGDVNANGGNVGDNTTNSPGAAAPTQMAATLLGAAGLAVGIAAAAL
jgi:hypothetical protein